MNYSEALQFLYSRTSHDRGQAVNNIDTHHTRMRTALKRLGNPHTQFKSVHIAGTKGKGSTAAMMASCLRAMNVKVGLFTSPHLHSFRERIQVNGVLIPQEDVAQLTQRVREATHDLNELTTFEAITLLGFLYFAEQQVDWAVIEVGLGGRYDPTNVITPRVSIITSLSYDHTAWLGNTLDKIAFEKAGIIKQGVPVVAHSQALEATQVIERVAQEQNAPITWLGRHWRWRLMQSNIERQTFEVKQVAFKRSEENPHPNNLEGIYDVMLLGKHQLDNALGVIAALDVLRNDESNTLPITAAAIRNGLHNTRWIGRFEVLRVAPPLIIDGAHNIDSINKLATTLAENFIGKRWTVIFGCYADKDAEGMLRALAPRVARWIMVQGSNPRARTAQELMTLAGQLRLRATSADSVAAALDSIRNTDECVCVTGSVTLVGDARAAWLGIAEKD